MKYASNYLPVGEYVIKHESMWGSKLPASRGLWWYQDVKKHGTFDPVLWVWPRLPFCLVEAIG